jgi:hypothetical protein
MNPAQHYVMVVTRPHEVQTSLMNFIFYGVLERFPGLKLVSAEKRYRLGAATARTGGSILLCIPKGL